MSKARWTGSTRIDNAAPRTTRGAHLFWARKVEGQFELRDVIVRLGATATDGDIKAY